MYSLKMVYFLTLNNDKKLMSACGNVFVENKCMCTHLSFNNSCKTKPRIDKDKNVNELFLDGKIYKMVSNFIIITLQNCLHLHCSTGI